MKLQNVITMTTDLCNHLQTVLPTDDVNHVMAQVVELLQVTTQAAYEDAARLCDKQAHEQNNKRKRLKSEGEYTAAFFAEAWRNAHEVDAAAIRARAKEVLQ